LLHKVLCTTVTQLGKSFQTDVDSRASKEGIQRSSPENPDEDLHPYIAKKGVPEKMRRRTLPVISSLILAFSTIAFAQQGQTPSPDNTSRPDTIRPKDGRGRGMRDHRRDMFGWARELNLSDEQRQQQRAIIQRHLESTTAQREELARLRQKRIAGTFTAEDEARAKALHREFEGSRKEVRDELSSILTPEQRSKLEQMQTQRKARRQEMQKRRTENLQENPQ
jgi:protein CpxP